MRLIVIGGTGFVGPAIVEQALTSDHDVAVYHRGQSHSELDPDAPHVHGSTLEIGGHIQEISGFRPDAIIDTSQFRTDTTQSVIKALTGLCERYVLVSSIDVYRGYGILHRTEPGPHQPMPVSEGDVLRTLPSFDQTETDDNIFAERAALDNGVLPVTVVRAPAIFGRGDRQKRISQHLAAIRDGGGVVRMPETLSRFRFSRGYLPNIADALIVYVADRRPGNHLYNLADEEALSNESWFRLIANAVGWEGRLEITLDSAEDAKVDYSQDLYTDTSKIRRELGYTETVPMDEAVRLTVEWDECQGLTRQTHSPAPEPLQDHRLPNTWRPRKPRVSCVDRSLVLR